MTLYPARYPGRPYLFAGLVLYVAAKGFELADKGVFLFLGQTVSGHTLKHLVAAGAVACVFAMLRSRRSDLASNSDLPVSLDVAVADVRWPASNKMVR